MIIPIVGATYQMEAVSFDNQRCVNLIPLVSESGSSKSVAALRSTPGLSQFTTIGGGGIRGGIESDERGFFISGNQFYEIFDDGTSTLRGTLDTNTTICSLEENPTQIMIVDGSFGYIFTKATNVFVKITDGDFPIPSDLTFQDGYFIVTEKDTSNFYISGINNGLTWGALDFTTVESSPDKLIGLRSDSSNLWLFGTKSTEIYRNTGNALFPFQRIPGAVIEVGCAASNTIQEISNRLIWLGTDENGDSIVWGSSGYNAERISTQAIEKKIAEGSDFNESYSWVYHERGHFYYMLQVKGLNTTLCFDLSTNLWHERVYRDPETAREKQHRGSCHIFFDKKHLVGDRALNKIYQMSLDNYSDDGDPLIKLRITPHYAEEKTLISHAQLELDMEPAVGLNDGQGSDPQIMMQYSDDGGQNYGSQLWRTLGKIGETRTRVRWNKLGRSRDRVYKIFISDPVFIQINEGILNGV